MQAGYFDIMGPEGNIILPAIWEDLIEPDMAIQMAMWPMEQRPPLSSRHPSRQNPSSAPQDSSKQKHKQPRQSTKPERTSSEQSQARPLQPNVPPHRPATGTPPTPRPPNATEQSEVPKPKRVPKEAAQSNQPTAGRGADDQAGGPALKKATGGRK